MATIKVKLRPSSVVGRAGTVMATIKVKLRPSSVVGRAGTVYYQLSLCEV